MEDDDMVEAILAAEADARAQQDKRAGAKRKREPEAGAGAGAGAGAAKRARREDHDGEGALQALLHKSLGFPLPANSTRFRLNAPKLREPAGPCPGPGGSALGAVYWIHKDAAAAVVAADPHTYDSVEEKEPERKGGGGDKGKDKGKAPTVLLKGKGGKGDKGGNGKGTGTGTGKGKSKPWYETMPWWPQLNVQPKASSMNAKPPPPFPVWYKHSSPDKEADWLGVPRHFGVSHFGLPAKDVRTDGVPMAPGIVFDPEKRRPFRPEQEAAFAAVMASLFKCGGAFCQADCGFGKTGLIIRILLALGVRGAIICTQVVLMRQMLYDITGKPWTWADLSEVVLLANGGLKEAVGQRCPLTGADLSGVAPEGLVRAYCIGAPVLDADGKKAKRAKAGKCFRLCSKAGQHTWLQQSSVEREARAAAMPCPHCGGHFGPAPAWEAPSPPKVGWAPKARVGWLQGAYLDAKGRVSKRCRVENTDIVLISSASAVKCDYPWATLGLGAVAFDEAHRTGSPTVSQIAHKLACRYIFGVSATPVRLDGSEHVLYWLLGPTAFVYMRTAEVTGLSGTVRVRQVQYTKGEAKEVFYRNGQLGFSTMVANLVLDPLRNRLILALASDAVRQGRRKILIITSTILHAVLLSRALMEQGFYDTAVLRGGVKPAAVAHAQNPSTRVVVATYHYLAEGYDDAYIDTMILATPRAHVQQAVGRSERTMEGKLVPLVYDITDGFSCFEGMAWKRHKFYKSRAFAIARETDDVALARIEAAQTAEDELVPDAAEVEAAAREFAAEMGMEEEYDVDEGIADAESEEDDDEL